MALSPLEIRNKTFSIVRKGYERSEVNRFLDDVAGQLQAFADSAEAAERRAADAEAARKASTATDATVAESAPEPEPTPEETPEPEPEPTPEPEPVPEPEPPVAEPAQVSEPPRSFAVSGADDFDRVGNEISLMLRQAQESALKIRTDAEIEARTLVDQVRLDIESDRAAHEQAAGELISRTEERASALRADAENYAAETRRAADEFAATKREDVDAYQRDAEVSADADRKLAAEKLESAKREAEATISNAEAEAEATRAQAEEEARVIRDHMINEAQNTLGGLADAERESRANLVAARTSIDAALAHIQLSEVTAPEDHDDPEEDDD